MTEVKEDKIRIVQRDTFDVIASAVNKTVNLIRPTYGPAGNKVIISKQLHKIVVDDGVQIARDLELNDPAENAVLNVIRETAIKTNDLVGDGTTGALIMLQGIVNAVSELQNRDTRKIEKELRKGFEEARTQLKKMSKEVVKLADLEKVARISFDDPKISKIIAEAWYKLGKNGVLTVDRSGTMETFIDITEGIQIDRGYVSPYMITNPQRMEAVVEKPYILITDYRLTEVNDILPIMEKMVAKKLFNLVLIAENIEQNALATAIVNKMQQKFNIIAVNAPLVGTDRTIFLEDMAIMTNAKFYSQGKGDKLEDVQIEDLGRADRFIATRDSSVIVGPRSKKGEVTKAIADLGMAKLSAKTEREKDQINNRVARFSNKIGVVKVGAATEQEEKALKYKAEDAIHAVHAAYKGGVVPGAGLALSRIKTSSPILNKALKQPHTQLSNNVGTEMRFDLKDNEAFNVVTEEVGDFMKVGVMDPVDVLIAGVESAVSIASLLITSKGMIVENPQN